MWTLQVLIKWTLQVLIKWTLQVFIKWILQVFIKWTLQVLIKWTQLDSTVKTMGSIWQSSFVNANLWQGFFCEHYRAPPWTPQGLAVDTMGLVWTPQGSVVNTRWSIVNTTGLCGEQYRTPLQTQQGSVVNTTCARQWTPHPLWTLQRSIVNTTGAMLWTLKLTQLRTLERSIVNTSGLRCEHYMCSFWTPQGYVVNTKAG